MLYMTGPSYKKFRTVFMPKFSFIAGMLFEAGHFSNVTSAWGVSFTIWTSGQTLSTTVQVKDVDSETGEIVTVGIKSISNVDNGIPASDWIRQIVKGLPKFDAPQMTNPINIKTKGKTMRGRLIKSAFGCLNNGGNNVNSNVKNVGLFSSAFNNGNGVSVNIDNACRASALFTARKSICPNWINQNDEYSAPNEAHTEYQQWNNDAIVYSLFNNSSNQSSLRDVEYKGKSWNIENEWFWMSNTEIRQLANEQGNDTIYQDTKQFPKERFVYKKLQEVTLSSDAQEVLDMASALVRKTFEYRDDMGEGEELHLNAWDAGWYQIKRILKEYFPDDLKTFVEKYKAFEDRMREGVYKFGFLKGGFEPA